jgi:long-chain acyl-CoA synthetase
MTSVDPGAVPGRLSFEQATRQLTAPDGPFAIVDLEIAGAGYRAFAGAPPSLRAVFDAARARGEEDFLVYGDERWTFARVLAEADALGAALVSHYGVRKGDRVALALRNLPEWVVAFTAVLSVGAVAVALNAWWTAEELDYALADSAPRVLVADPERVARAAESCRRLGTTVLAVRAGAETSGPGVDRWEDVVVPGPAMPVVALDPDDDATIFYTSGTTGQAKGAVSTHRAIAQALTAFACGAAIQRLRRGRGLVAGGRPPVFILVVPLFHVTGCIPVMLSCFANGWKLVMMYRWDPETALRLIEREGVTNFVGVPTQSWDLLESPRFAEFDTSTLTSVGGGGAPAPPALVDRVERSFSRGRPTIGYGMTETNGYGPGNHGDDYLSHPTSAGRAVPIMAVDVRDAHGASLGLGSSGELWLKGPNLFRGYWGRPQDTAEALVAGWLRTGDIGRVDAEGFVYVEDRAKDMVIRGGENVYCAEVEAAIYEHPAVLEAAVFGLPDVRLGEAVAAVVVPKPGLALTAAELDAHLRRRLAAYKVPSRLTVSADRLPRSATGKVLKRELRRSAD